MQPQSSVTYFTLTKEQLDDYAKEVTKNVLSQFGVNFDEDKAKFTPDRTNELRPLSFWLKKLNVNRTTVWRWQKQGLIKPRCIGKKVFFCQRDFDQMFAEQKGI